MELTREVERADSNLRQSVTVRMTGTVPKAIQSRFFAKLKEYGLNPTEKRHTESKKSYIKPRLTRINSLIKATTYLLDAFEPDLGAEKLALHKTVLSTIHKKFNDTVTHFDEKFSVAQKDGSAEHIEVVDAQMRHVIQELVEYVKPIMVNTLGILKAEDTDESVMNALDRAEQYYLLTQSRPVLVSISNISDIFTMQVELPLENFDAKTLEELHNIREGKTRPAWFIALPKMQQTLLRYTLSLEPDPQKWSQVSRLREIPGLANLAESKTVSCSSEDGVLYESSVLRSAHPASRDVRKQPFADVFVERSCRVAEERRKDTPMMLLTLISPLRPGYGVQSITPDSSLYDKVLTHLGERKKNTNTGGISYAANLSLNYGQYLGPKTDAVSILRDDILYAVKAKFPYIPEEEREENFIKLIRAAYQFAGSSDGWYFSFLKEAASNLLRQYEPDAISSGILAEACKNLEKTKYVNFDEKTRHSMERMLGYCVKLYPLSVAQEKILSENLFVASIAKACEGAGGDELPATQVVKNVATSILTMIPQADPDAHNLHLAARFLILAESVGITGLLTCVSGKDRTACVLLVKLAMEIFFQKMGYSYDSSNALKADREHMARIFAQLYVNQHHTEFASQNAPGAYGIKHTHKYLPTYYVEAIAALGLDSYMEDALASMNDLDKLMKLQASKVNLSPLTLLTEGQCRQINNKLTALLGEKGLWSTKGRDLAGSTKLPTGIKDLRKLFGLDDGDSTAVSDKKPVDVLLEAISIIKERPSLEEKPKENPSWWNVYPRDKTTARFYGIITSILDDFPKAALSDSNTLEKYVSRVLEKLDALKGEVYKATESESSRFLYN